MALSQADFYAFSQATGTQVPEDAAGRAQLAPYVLEWRRSQLKQPSQEGEGSNLLQTVGTLAAAAGLGTAAVLGARRLARGVAARSPVQPVNVQVQDQAVRRAAQPIPKLTATPGGQPGPDTARPPIPRQPTQSLDIPDFFGRGTVPKAANPGVQTVSTRALPAARTVSTRGALPPARPEYTPSRALPAAEPEYAAYRPDPTDAVSAEVAEARRKAATADLIEKARRAAPYQAEIPGVKATLMALRSPAGALAEETGELIAKAESRPLSAAPAQQNLLGYVREAAEPQGDAVDRLLREYNQLAESQARADRRAQASVRQYQMEVQGKAMRVLDELKRESLVENQQAKQAFNVDQAINALDSGEDQMTGRVRQQLQRNEDLNLSKIDQAEDFTNNIDVAASMTPDGVPLDQAEGFDLRTGERFSIRQNIKQQYPKSTLGSTGLVPGQKIQMEAETLSADSSSAVERARNASLAERQRLAAQGFAGQRLEQQLLENMRSNFPEGREAMQQLEAETKKINRTGTASALSVLENVGSVEPLKQGEPTRVSSPASQQSDYEGGIRGMSRIVRDDLQEEGGGIGVYGFEPKYSSGAVRKAGTFGESDYGDLGYEYSAAAELPPTTTFSEARGKVVLEDLRDPYSKLSNEQLGELTLYGSDADKYNAERQLKKRASSEIATRLRTLQLANKPDEAQSFVANFREELS